MEPSLSGLMPPGQPLHHQEGAPGLGQGTPTQRHTPLAATGAEVAAVAAALGLPTSSNQGIHSAQPSGSLLGAQQQQQQQGPDPPAPAVPVDPAAQPCAAVEGLPLEQAEQQQQQQQTAPADAATGGAADAAKGAKYSDQHRHAKDKMKRHLARVEVVSDQATKDLQVVQDHPLVMAGVQTKMVSVGVLPVHGAGVQCHLGGFGETSSADTKVVEDVVYELGRFLVVLNAKEEAKRNLVAATANLRAATAAASHALEQQAPSRGAGGTDGRRGRGASSSRAPTSTAAAATSAAETAAQAVPDGGPPDAGVREAQDLAMCSPTQINQYIIRQLYKIFREKKLLPRSKLEYCNAGAAPGPRSSYAWAQWVVQPTTPLNASAAVAAAAAAAGETGTDPLAVAALAAGSGPSATAGSGVPACPSPPAQEGLDGQAGSSTAATAAAAAATDAASEGGADVVCGCGGTCREGRLRLSFPDGLPFADYQKHDLVQEKQEELLEWARVQGVQLPRAGGQVRELMELHKEAVRLHAQRPGRQHQPSTAWPSRVAQGTSAAAAAPPSMRPISSPSELPAQAGSSAQCTQTTAEAGRAAAAQAVQQAGGGADGASNFPAATAAIPHPASQRDQAGAQAAAQVPTGGGNVGGSAVRASSGVSSRAATSVALRDNMGSSSAPQGIGRLVNGAGPAAAATAAAAVEGGAEALAAAAAGGAGAAPAAAAEGGADAAAAAAAAAEGGAGAAPATDPAVGQDTMQGGSPRGMRSRARGGKGRGTGTGRGGGRGRGGSRQADTGVRSGATKGLLPPLLQPLSEVGDGGDTDDGDELFGKLPTGRRTPRKRRVQWSSPLELGPGAVPEGLEEAVPEGLEVPACSSGAQQEPRRSTRHKGPAAGQGSVLSVEDHVHLLWRDAPFATAKVAAIYGNYDEAPLGDGYIIVGEVALTDPGTTAKIWFPNRRLKLTAGMPFTDVKQWAHKMLKVARCDVRK